MRFLFITSLHLLSQFPCSAQLAPYFGVPLGTLKYAKLGIRGEVFLADDHTVVLDRFTHKPQKSGCTALMIGPPRRQDLKRKVGDGILLSYTQPNFSWEEIRRYRRRAKREQGSNKETDIAKVISKRLLKYGPVTAATTPTTEEDVSMTAATTPTADEDVSTMQTSTSTLQGIDESYEEIEYIEDEEVTEEREENRVIPTVKDGEAHHRQNEQTETSSTLTTVTSTTTPTPAAASSTPTQTAAITNVFPTLVTEPTAFTATATEATMIVFSKAEKPLKPKSQHENGPSPLNKLHDDSGKGNIDGGRPAGHWDQSYSLPPATDEQVAFLLTNGGRLSDYKWIGLYDQCHNKSIPLLWLLDVDPPREEEVGSLSSTGRNVSTGSVRILNCNTILVPNLTFEADPNMPKTFFFVGVGNETHFAQQTKARTIGYEYNEPLESHLEDDVMIRLPKGVRTFDVDYLSIFNEDEKKSYGFVALPSLLVPPCVDDA